MKYTYIVTQIQQQTNNYTVAIIVCIKILTNPSVLRKIIHVRDTDNSVVLNKSLWITGRQFFTDDIIL